MGPLLQFAGALDRIARISGKTIGWIMIPLIVVIMFDVVTRKLDFTRLYFSEWTATSGVSVSTILQDLQWHFHGALLMLTFGFGYLANAHVRVDVFRELFSRRPQAWLELFGLIICAIPFLSYMILYSYDMVELSFHQGEGSESLTGIGQRWIIKSAMIIGFVLALIAVIATLFRLFVYLFGSDSESSEAENALEIFAGDLSELEAARQAAEEKLRQEAEQKRRDDRKGGA